ncbi:MAG: DAK2 domain-containing protein [Clostridium sp.]
MELNYIDGENLYYAFISGAREVIKAKKNLNKINVFPVADGDTGTNLAITMNGIVKNSKKRSSAVETFKSIADAALTGARGNSGTIFAQYINGITMELYEEDKLTVSSFSTSVQKAVGHAYSAIENPVEGTMISVIKDWANSVYLLRDTSKDFIEVLTKSLKEASKSLEATPEKLNVLKLSGVVDSGAKGFVTFLEGFLSYLKNGELQDYKEEEIDFGNDFKDIHPEGNEEIKFKFCTEGLIEGKNLDLEKIKSEIRELGDSLIVAGNKQKVKIHIHTNEPAKLFSKLNNFGEIIEQKAEDMKMQNNIVRNRKYNIALVTDSIADIPKKLIEEYQIYQLPLNLNIGKSTYLDRVTINSEELYSLLDKTKEIPSSSQPTIKSVESVYSYLSSYYDSIIVVSVSKEMSGTCNVFRKAAEGFNKENEKITVINSKANSAAQGLVVLKAAEEIAKGLGHKEIVDEVIKTVEKTKIFVSVSDLRGMVRSGRVSNVVGVIGKLVNLKPIVSINEDGKGILIGKAFSIKKNTDEIYKLVKSIKEKDGIEKYTIVHGKGEKRLDSFEKELTKIIGKKPEFIEEVSSIVAMSAGENTLAIGLIKN